MAEFGVRRCRPLLGTFVEIAAPFGSERAVERAFVTIAHAHARMSFHEETSDLAAIRRAPAGATVAIDRETMTVLRLAEDLNIRSAGLFDVAVGTALVSSGFLPRLPGIDLRHMTGTAADIELIDDAHVRCHRRILIDLGGIAKGFAVDRAAESLIADGIDHAIVNAGGDLRVVGDRALRIRLRGFDGAVEAIVAIADAALASSGERRERRRYRGRAVTPHLGHDRAPVSDDRAVSVVAERCAIADAMTKIALADPALAVAMLNELGGALVDRLPAAEAA